MIAFFAFMDAQQLEGIKELDTEYQAQNGWTEDNNIWRIYWDKIQPVYFWLWIGIAAIIATMYYLFTKDKSEAIAIFLVPAIAIYFGSQDLLYYLFSPEKISMVGCWADVLPPVRIISDLFGETCPTQTSFLASGFLGLIIGAIILFKLKYLEPRRKKK
jgi:hypothetical protein